MMRSFSLALVCGAIALACGAAVPGTPLPTPSASAGELTSRGAAASASPVATPFATAVPSPSIAPVGPGIELHTFMLASGELDGAELLKDAPLALGERMRGTWTSPWREPGFAFTRLIPSWNAETPEGTWITVEGRVRRASGAESGWLSFGTWAAGDRTMRRSTVNGQRFGELRVETDTLVASVPLAAYQLRVTLARASGSTQTPLLRVMAAIASADAAVRQTGASLPSGRAIDLDVPMYSQEIHAGEYPQYAGGGEAWCSPTSVAMVLAFWRTGPKAAEMSWIDPKLADPQVIHAARSTYDVAYRGTGNWAFNTAYAATYGLEAFVTQLRSLNEAERFIAAGIPLVLSLKIAPGALPGFLFPQGSDGHILVLRGFTASGDAIVNEPAVFSNAAVRMTYPRAAFERAWIGGSGGVAYVIRPPTVPLPPRVRGGTPNW